jgi:hypothetical protein
MLKFGIYNLLSLLAAVILFPYAIAGLLASAVYGFRFNRWVSAFASLALAIVLRLVTDKWSFVVASARLDEWYYEITLGIISWAITSIFVSAFARWPSEVRKGYNSVFQIDDAIHCSNFPEK